MKDEFGMTAVVETYMVMVALLLSSISPPLPPSCDLIPSLTSRKTCKTGLGYDAQNSAGENVASHTNVNSHIPIPIRIPHVYAVSIVLFESERECVCVCVCVCVYARAHTSVSVCVCVYV